VPVERLEGFQTGRAAGESEEEFKRGLLLSTLDKAVGWARKQSMWPVTFGLACCAIEMMSIVSSRYDIARFGAEVFRSSPRQADLLIVSGRVAHKMAAPLRQIYDQMLEPKWVIAMGACASSGGMFNNYAVLQSVDKTTKSQVLLQHTVEGLSVIVIAYYVAGLGGYLFKGFQEMGWLSNANLVSAIFVPIAIGLALVITTVSKKYLHRKLSRERPSSQSGPTGS